MVELVGEAEAIEGFNLRRRQRRRRRELRERMRARRVEELHAAAEGELLDQRHTELSHEIGESVREDTRAARLGQLLGRKCWRELNRKRHVGDMALDVDPDRENRAGWQPSV